MAIVGGRKLPADPRASVATERVVVKLRATALTQPSRGIAAQVLGAVWAGLAQRFPGIQVRPYFMEALGLSGATALPAGGAPDGAWIDSQRYIAVDVPPGFDPNDVATELRHVPAVETAYREGGPVPPPVNPDDDPRSVRQRHLNAAPGGVDARWAWAYGPVDGAGVGFVDLEQGWTLDHEDLAAASVSLISGVNFAYHGHGTAVLGQVASVDNAFGGIGIAPAVTTRVVSQWRSPGIYSTADAILSAAAVMRRGDVLLLEAQTTYPTATDHVPVEVEALVFDAIAATVKRGIVVIEAAGNGAIDLDRFQDLHGRHVLNRNSPDFRDSGAILVGAGSSRSPHRRLPFSNFGTRVNCYAWGEHIDTCGDGWMGRGANTYTTDFGGTSGASPIVAGCAVLLQAWRDGAGLPPYTPLEIRALLADPALNTLSSSPGFDMIGVMPDLRAIIEQERSRLPAPPPNALVTEGD